MAEKLEKLFIDFVKENLDIVITKEHLLKFKKYYNLLVEWNKKINLTAIENREDVYIKHFYDSITLIKTNKFSENSSVCDVGAGAGFPSIPLKIVRPDLNITIIDSLNKRINFLNVVIDELNLDGIKAIHSRAEDYAVENRDKFDIVTARAVARLNILSELCIPLVKEKGYFISMKGQNAIEELNEAKGAVNKLGGKTSEVITFKLPKDCGQRSIIIINKDNKTPRKYPRQFGKIKKKPLL